MTRSRFLVFISSVFSFSPTASRFEQKYSIFDAIHNTIFRASLRANPFFFLFFLFSSQFLNNSLCLFVHSISNREYTLFLSHHLFLKCNTWNCCNFREGKILCKLRAWNLCFLEERVDLCLVTTQSVRWILSWWRKWNVSSRSVMRVPFCSTLKPWFKIRTRSLIICLWRRKVIRKRKIIFEIFVGYNFSIELYRERFARNYHLDFYKIDIITFIVRTIYSLVIHDPILVTSNTKFDNSTNHNKLTRLISNRILISPNDKQR